MKLINWFVDVFNVFCTKLLQISHNWDVKKGMFMNLWVDDIRLPPDETWYWVRTAKGAIKFLTAHHVKNWSLDHDLGWGGNGYKVILHLVEVKETTGFSLWPPEEPTLHTSNPVGRMNMRQLLDRYAPYKARRA